MKEEIKTFLRWLETASEEEIKKAKKKIEEEKKTDEHIKKFFLQLIREELEAREDLRRLK